MRKRNQSQQKIFQFFAVGRDESNSDWGEKDTQDDLRYLQIETVSL